MLSIFARKALTPSGWCDDVRIDVDGGRIAAVRAGSSPGGAEVFDCVIPGLCNAHSHAFQRALAGRTEVRSPKGRDNFWTWRERMYALASEVDAARLEAIARQAYVEMVSSGYTSVAEFHYLHREPGHAAAGESMFDAIRGAATSSGIRLCYVPVLYERAGFDEPGPVGAQRLFALSLDEFFAHVDTVAAAGGDALTVGIGAHSIRAVTAESLSAIASRAAADQLPMHLHIAEQRREVDQSLDVYGRRPVRWLLENFDVGPGWCLVHATHMDREETESLASSGAVVSLCPSTEANLGDGLFPLADFLSDGGHIAIGSDSHVSINPFEELRWLEYGQRLASLSRNVAAIAHSHVGRELFERAVEGGVRACGGERAGLAEDADADLVCLYGDDPMLVGHDDASRLDALVFSGYELPIERVMVNGTWQVVDGVHVGRAESRRDFAKAMESLGVVE